jgi:2-polyprenyl-6-methoxyphenol hydroxylase-like FAD-dependent oxidoreductase
MVFNAKDKQAFAHNASTIGAFAPHVVFLGDANHAVTPFAGNGANMALCDGWDLAEQLLKSASVEEAVKMYDDIVVPRANKVVKQSHIAIAIGHSQGWRLYLAMIFLRFLKLILLRHYVR